MDDNTAQQPQETPPAPVISPPTGPKVDPERDRQLEEVEKFLGEIAGQGYQMAIHRVEPRWCGGYLDTWEVSEPLSMSEIRDEYGGRKFRLRLFNQHGGFLKQFTIRIDEIPRRHGEAIRPPPPPPPTPAAAPYVPPRKEGPDANEIIMRELFNMVRAQNEQIAGLFMRLATPPPAAAAVPTLPAQNPIDFIKQIQGTIGVFREAASEFGSQDNGEGQGPQMMMKFLEMLDKKGGQQPQQQQAPQQQQQQRQQQPRRGPPGPIGPPQYAQQPQPYTAPPTRPEAEPTTRNENNQAQQAAPQAAPHPTPNPDQGGEPYEEPQPPDDLEDVPIEEDLIDLGPEESGLAVAAALQKWHPTQQKTFLDAVLNQDTLDALAAYGGQSPSDGEQR